MAHKEQQDFCLSVKKILPEHFISKNVLDVGSLDINGNNRYLFENCKYLGIDIGAGKNVDIIVKGHEYNVPNETYNTIISSECFEHDMYYNLTILNIIRLLKSNGLFLFTCATTGRPEHGTRKTSVENSPFTATTEGWSDYYKNLTETDILNIAGFKESFKDYKFSTNNKTKDLYFYGIKK